MYLCLYQVRRVSSHVFVCQGSEVMYQCVRCIHFSSFYDFSKSVVFFLFLFYYLLIHSVHLITLCREVTSMRPDVRGEISVYSCFIVSSANKMTATIKLNVALNIHNNITPIQIVFQKCHSNNCSMCTSMSQCYQIHVVPITTKVVSSNPAHGEVHLIQHRVIKFISDMAGGLFSLGTTVSSTNNTDPTI